MKLFKLGFLSVIAAMLVMGLTGSAFAFHDGGVGYCDGCHTMHNSIGNQAMNVVNGTGTAQFQGKAFLLRGSDDSSTCLNCHAAPDGPGAPSGYHVMTFPVPTVASGIAPTERNPGGDFAWLTMTFPVVGTTPQSIGERHGHNIVASDYNLLADTTLLTAPGGQYDATKLSCASCHDPHSRARIDSTGAIVYSKLGIATAPIIGSGSYGAAATTGVAVGVYRLLGGASYSQLSYINPLPFNTDPPVAVAPSTYNRTEATTQTRVAYGSGMSEWCANCHRSIHDGNVNAGNTALIHPAGNTALLTATANDLAGNATGTTIATIYNDYINSGNLAGSQATSYLSLVPYEEGLGGANISTLAGDADITGTKTAGPTTGTENVMCLTCHRAHASGFTHITRWNGDNEFLTVASLWPDVATAGDSNNNSSGMTGAQTLAAYYDRPPTQFATYQRSLCNKCHAKD